MAGSTLTSTLLHDWKSCHLAGFLSEGLTLSPALPRSPFSPQQCTQSALKPILIIPLWLKGISGDRCLTNQMAAVKSPVSSSAAHRFSLSPSSSQTS